MDRSSVLVIGVIILAVVSVLAIALIEEPHHNSRDADNYVDLAEGRIENVSRSFANRILHPYLVSKISPLFEGNGEGRHLVGTSFAFLLLGCLSLAVIVASVAVILKSYVPPLAILAIVVTPFTLHLFHHYYLQDVFYSALLGLFFLSLFYNRIWLAVALILLLQLTRESTFLLVVIFSALCIHRGEYKVVVGSVCAMVIGMVITKYISSFAQPNLHGLSQMFYMVFKVPFNLAENLLGIEFWTDSLANRLPQNFPDAPIYMLQLPEWLQFGKVMSVGIYSLEILTPLTTLVLLLTTFGVLPAVVLHSLLNAGKNVLDGAPFYILVAFSYGIISYLLGTSIGASVDRLIGYGWPCFWIAAPFLARHWYQFSGRSFKILVVAQVVVAWLPFALTKMEIEDISWALISIFAATAIYAVVWRELSGMVVARRKPAIEPSF